TDLSKIMGEREVYAAFLRAIESQDLDSLAGCYADGCQTTSSTWLRQGRAEVVAGWRRWFADFSDIKLAIESLCSLGLHRCRRVTERATERRSGRRYFVQGASVHKFVDGKIASDYVYVIDFLSVNNLGWSSWPCLYPHCN